MDIIVTSLR